MGPATRNALWRQSLKRLAWFTLSIALISGLVSGILRCWIALSWWQIFRRCVSIVAAVVLIAAARMSESLSFRSLGLGSFRQGRGQFLKGLGIGFAVVLVLVGGYLISGVCRISVQDPARVRRVLSTFVPIAVLVAVLEELVFRGYVMQQLLVYGQRLAVFLSSLAYALVHLRTTLVWPGSLFEVVGLSILGVVLAVCYFRTKQLYLAIGLHAGLAYCARASKLLIEFTVPSLDWLVGTTRLVNGVVAWLVLLVVGCGIRFASRQRRKG